MPSFTAKFIVNDAGTTEQAVVTVDEWDVGPITGPPYVPPLEYPRVIPWASHQSLVVATDYWDYQYKSAGLPVYKYRSLVGSCDEYVPND